MEWTFDRYRDPDYFRITTAGVFEVPTLVKMFAELREAEGWAPDIPLLFDNRKIDMQGDFAEMQKSSRVLDDFISGGGAVRVASLMGSPADFGRSRQIITMMGAESDAFAVETFYDEAEAMKWLLK